jgi:hypothetical protein
MTVRCRTQWLPQQVTAKCPYPAQKPGSGHADETVAAAFIQMLNKESGAIRIYHRQGMTVLVLPIQQMGDRTQMSTTVTARVAAIDEMSAKGIK